MDEVIKLKDWQARLEKFSSDRNWNQFHNPKNLAMALSVEAAELVELFQWLSFEEVNEKIDEAEFRERVGEEISDVFFYLIRLADKSNIDLNKALERKFGMNGIKHPSS